MDNDMQATRMNDDIGVEKVKETNSAFKEAHLSFSLRATTLGEESDFEKSLKDSIIKAPVVESPKVIISDEKIEDKVIIEEKQTEITPEVVVEEPIAKAETLEDKSLRKEYPTPNNDVYGMALKNYNVGDIILGEILAIEKAGVFIDLNYKCEGFVSNEELGQSVKSTIKVGDKINLFINQLETKEGYTLLSKKRADWEISWREAYQAYKLKEVVEVNVENSVKGGLVANYQGLKGFIPLSLLSKANYERLDALNGKTISAIFVEVDKKRKKIIFSNKTPERMEMQAQSDILDTLEVGQVVKGRITSIKDFGAFVNINGIEGLIHISEISWDRIDKVEDILKVGDTLDVFILGIDKDSKKISLGLKQLTPDPWAKVDEMYPIDSIVKGKVSRITAFGAFIKLEKGLEGLVHISELSYEHVKKVEDVVNIGDELEIKVLRIIPEEQKIGLSLKQAANEEDTNDSTEQEIVASKVEVDVADSADIVDGADVDDNVEVDVADEVAVTADTLDDSEEK